MARKKCNKRNKKRYGKTRTKPTRENRHHLLYSKEEWRKNDATKALRYHPYCSKSIRVTAHKMLHEGMQDAIPAPSEKECRRIYRELEWLRRQHRLSTKSESLELRLDVLIHLLMQNPAENTETVVALKKERTLVKKLHI